MVNIVVIGAGIIGVTTAYRLKLKYPSVNVTVVAKDFSPNTTSDGSTGFWKPFAAGDTPPHQLWRLSKETYDHLFDAIRNDPSICCHGIHSTRATFLFEEKVEADEYERIAYDFHWLNERDLKRFPDNFICGYEFTSLIIESKKYIPWLSKKFTDLGGVFIRRVVHHISELAKDFDIVVNCSGLGAKELMSDEKCFPIRGQLLRVKAPWIKDTIVVAYKDCRLAHVVSVNDHVVLGGVAQAHDTNDKVSSTDKKWILESTRSLVPSLKHAEELYDWVGYRPARTKFRIEKEDMVCQIDGVKTVVKVIHNYGHGGSGITTHWGCAGDSVNMVTQILQEFQGNQSKL